MTRFTNNWFEGTPRENFEKHLLDIPIDSYLEIGVCEGASMIWVLENLQPKRAVGIDHWTRRKHQREMDQCKRNAYHNLQPWIKKGQCELVESDSVKYLANCEETFDLIYVDGGHSGPQAMLDFLLSYRLLSTNRRMDRACGQDWNVGGMLVIDDINRTWNRYPEVKIAQMQFELLLHGRMWRAWMESKQCAYVRLR